MVWYSHTLVGTCILILILQVTQAIKSIVYLGEANYEDTLEVNDLYKLPFFCHLSNIYTCDMLSIQTKVYDPEKNSLLMQYLIFYGMKRLAILCLGFNLALMAISKALHSI